MDVRRPVEALLPDLPNEEPWFELKFQLRELEADLGELLGRLRNWKAHLGTQEWATRLWSDLYELYILADHGAEAHAPRAVQLARCLCTQASGAPCPRRSPGSHSIWTRPHDARVARAEAELAALEAELDAQERDQDG